jgi:hypothetical protein
MNLFQNSNSQQQANALAHQQAMQQGQGLLSSGMLSAQQYNSLLWQTHMNKDPKDWMINGRAMTFDQWLDEIAPDDGPQRTFLILKYKK